MCFCSIILGGDYLKVNGKRCIKEKPTLKKLFQSPQGSGTCYNPLKINYKTHLWKMGCITVRFYYFFLIILGQTWKKKDKDEA